MSFSRLLRQRKNFSHFVVESASVSKTLPSDERPTVFKVYDQFSYYQRFMPSDFLFVSSPPSAYPILFASTVGSAFSGCLQGCNVCVRSQRFRARKYKVRCSFKGLTVSDSMDSLLTFLFILAVFFERAEGLLISLFAFWKTIQVTWFCWTSSIASSSFYPLLVWLDLYSYISCDRSRLTVFAFTFDPPFCDDHNSALRRFQRPARWTIRVFPVICENLTFFFFYLGKCRCSTTEVLNIST